MKEFVKLRQINFVSYKLFLELSEGEFKTGEDKTVVKFHTSDQSPSPSEPTPFILQ